MECLNLNKAIPPYLVLKEKFNHYQFNSKTAGAFVLAVLFTNIAY